MVAAPQEHGPRHKADTGAHTRGADSDPVTGVLTAMLPSFFVVGEPRRGTTALRKALALNPNVSFSKSKEMHFLLEHRSGLPVDSVRRAHLELFHPRLSRQTQAIGDGSVSYLCNRDAVRQTRVFDDRVGFIASVRNPVEMLRSCRARMLFSLGKHPRSVFEQLLAFLGVIDVGRPTFKCWRETSGFLSPWLQQLVMNPRAWAFRLV